MNTIHSYNYDISTLSPISNIIIIIVFRIMIIERNTHISLELNSTFYIYIGSFLVSGTTYIGTICSLTKLF